MDVFDWLFLHFFVGDGLENSGLAVTLHQFEPVSRNWKDVYREDFELFILVTFFFSRNPFSSFKLLLWEYCKYDSTRYPSVIELWYQFYMHQWLPMRSVWLAKRLIKYIFWKNLLVWNVKTSLQRECLTSFDLVRKANNLVSGKKDVTLALLFYSFLIKENRVSSWRTVFLKSSNQFVGNSDANFSWNFILKWKVGEAEKPQLFEIVSRLEIGPVVETLNGSGQWIVSNRCTN